MAELKHGQGEVAVGVMGTEMGVGSGPGVDRWI